MSGPWEDFGAQATAQGPWSDFAPQKQADPQLGSPQELTFAERYVAPALEKLGIGDIAGGNVRGSAVGRVAQGAADPGVALVQLGANAIGQGDSVNKAIQDEERKYQAARAEAGSTGFDPGRLAGNVGMTAFMAAASPAIGPLERAPALVKSAVQGAGFGALEPVTDGGDHFFREKGKQVGTGAVAGGVTSAVGSGIARLISPNASTNEALQLLTNEGVQPTIGQTLGGVANSIEQKATSIPILGDAILAARRRAVGQFDNAAINRAMSPIGERVEGSGQAAVAEAGNKLSDAYEQALAKIPHVNFDTPEFNRDLGQLTTMTQSLSPDLAGKFEKTLDNVVLNRMSPNGSMLGDFVKKTDSELGQLAARYGRSSVASEQEFGDAVKQLQSLMRQQIGRSSPDARAALAAADKGYANLVRVEGAAKAAKNTEGVFTPAQYNTAIQTADNSVRKRAVARGEALGQDLGSAGQSVLGNRVPDSGTTGRAFLAGGAAASGFLEPTIPLSLLASSAAYTPMVQNALRALVMRRPDAAPKAANYLRRLASLAPYATVPAIEQR